jgi:3-keto-disaccharide hydrolase
MKLPRIAFVLVAAVLFFAVAAQSRKAHSTNSPPCNPADSVDAFLGRWDLTLQAPDREYPSWLELTQKNGQLKAQMVGRWGNARPLPKVEITNGHLKFVSPKEEEDRNDDMLFEATLDGNRLSGTTSGPDGKVWPWSGERAPSLKRTATPKWGKPVTLFNGRDLSGWTMTKSTSASVWHVENGTLISPGEGPELINNSKFEDFKLHIEFNCGPDSNSGIYLRGRYEVQIETESASEPPSHHTGGVYGFLEPTPELPRKPGEWQTFDITLIGRMITVVQNGQTIIDNREIPGITGGALDSHEALPGPIYLQGSEKGHVAFRNMVLTPAEL